MNKKDKIKLQRLINASAQAHTAANKAAGALGKFEQ